MIPYGSQVAVDQVRLFRRDPALRWEYRVHEQILLAIRRARPRPAPDRCGHQPCRLRGPGLVGQKLQRNLALLLRQDAERPDDPITLYHLGQANQRLGRAAEALPMLRRSLELLPPDYSIRPRLFAAIARAHESLGQKAEALAVCRAGREQYPDVEELLFFEASFLHGQGDDCRRRGTVASPLEVPSGGQFAAGDAGRPSLQGPAPPGPGLPGSGREAEAECEWQRAVEMQPRFIPAWRELAELYLGQGRWQEFDEAVQHLEPSAAALLDARSQTARGELLSPRRRERIGFSPFALRGKIREGRMRGRPTELSETR